MPKDCPLNKFLDCKEEKCAWWIDKPEKGCVVKIYLERKLNEKT